MNMRLACDRCGSQPCLCQTFECPACEGEGEIEHPHLSRPASIVAESPPDPVKVECEDCGGSGEIKCSGPGDYPNGKCPFEAKGQRCACEAAWDRQQEDMASEPPPSARERQELAQRERDSLRSGVPI